MAESSRFRWRRLVLVGLIVGLPTWTASCAIRDHELHQSFEVVALGMSLDEVVQVMGSPKQIGNCEGIFKPWQRPDCTKAYIYASAWAPLNPEYPVVFFDKDNTVIAKADFQSP